MSESHSKRDEDARWRERTDERLVSLTSGQLDQNDRLDDIEDELKTFEALLEGKPEDKTDNGLKGDIHDISIKVNKLEALLHPDSMGHGGILSRLKALEAKSEKEEKTSEMRWKFYTAVAIAIVGLLTSVITNLDRIGAVFHKPVIEERKKSLKAKKLKVKKVVEPTYELNDVETQMY